MTKKKEEPVKAQTPESPVDEEQLPVLNMEDCEAFDPSADKAGDPNIEEEDDDIDDSEPSYD